ncbi:50S ribosomal protein L21 [Endozoicomonas sp. 4G]|uniref:50S ribosomal protein L21 n=1 Tax=Endozoicomonas sp. 4G TaxID=2872754 RepID=UPI0020787E38|nr:50S ribosomal protein L21 [Endozoicomonas sp. 4G]
MYAVIKTGGKQYRVAEGETLKVEKLDVAAGENLDISDVLLIADGEEVKIGAPVVEGAKVTAEVVAHGRGPKIKIIKFKRRKHHRKQMGHRQWFTELKITSIAG